MNVGLTWRHAMWKAYDILALLFIPPPLDPFNKTENSFDFAHLQFPQQQPPFPSLISVQIICDTFPPPAIHAPTCSVVSEMTGDDRGLSNFVEQEESSIMESTKRESSEWTDEKHSLYLKSMEASFVDQLYNSLDMRCRQSQNNCFSETKSSRKVHTGTHYPSGEFKVLQHGSWSRIDFRREKSVANVADRPHVSSRNPWIQHFRKSKESSSPQENRTLTATTQQTSYSDTEVIDQNFVEEDSAMERVTTQCGKKRKNTCAVSKLGNDQVASFWHLSCNGNRR